MLTIDGSQGEGGGQILRTSLAMSLVTSAPVRMINVRAGRKKPGLMRQHLTAVQAARTIGRAAVEGADIGSQTLTFTPREVSRGDYHFAVGTAGSATLVLQTVLPALLTASGSSVLTLEGGTHNMGAPPFDFLQKTFLPLINQMGPKIEVSLERPGFYPAGGGKFVVTITPAERLVGLELLERGELIRQSARAVVSRLPDHIGRRELDTIKQQLGWPDECLAVEEVTSSPGPGNVVMIEFESANLTEVFTAFGRRGVRAEAVARQAADAAARYLGADVPVGEHLADQLLVPLALAGGSAFKTFAPTSHTRTNIEVLKRFIDADIAMREYAADSWLFELTAP
jgi:RNA 3'-terminal phosphate cyclase (ATP)